MHGLARLLLAVPFFALAVTLPARAEEPRLERVVLSTGGVAYSEFSAEVSGDAVLRIDVRLDQVDDVLKSLMVFDPAGRIAGVSLPGRAPLDTVFRDLPFDETALSSPVALLNGLRGARVSVDGSTETAGRLIGVTEEVAIVDDRQVARHRVAVMTEAGLRTVLLEDARAIRFEEAGLRADVGRALEAIARHRTRDRRTLAISLKGSGARTVRIGYVAAAPLWKTAYRLVLARDGETGFLQGWAVLENQTGRDWRDVAVTLVSGNPVTFRQALYESYFVDRPELPVEVFGRVLPRRDAGGVVPPQVAQTPRFEPGGALQRAMPKAESAAAGGILSMMSADAAPAPGAVAAATEQATASVLFAFDDPVDLPAGHSQMLALVSREVPVERMWLYQPDTHARHPLAAARITNDTDSGLPPGILTLFERGAGGVTFVGDAELPVLAAGDSRFVSFALDRDTTIDREDRQERTVVGASLSRGVLETRVKTVLETIYTVEAPASGDRPVTLEHPRRPGWELVSPKGDYEVTERFHRLPLAVPAGETRALTVRQERTDGERLVLGDLPPRVIFQRAASGDLDPKVRELFEDLAERHRALRGMEQARERLRARAAAIAEDQGRVRANLESVPSDSDLARRYLAGLTAQEDELESIGDETRALDRKIAEARAELDAYIARARL